jgi:hypothetical protein
MINRMYLVPNSAADGLLLGYQQHGRQIHDEGLAGRQNNPSGVFPWLSHHRRSSEVLLLLLV